MWRRHVEGCARLIQSLGIHGFSGKLEQALFWCFARMGESPLNICSDYADKRKIFGEP